MKNQESLLSVVVPVYNVEKYLEQCLESIIQQEYSNLEIIIVNDCSPDNCIKIIESFAKKDERIIIIDCKENGGYGKAINLGIARAGGEWIGIVESDDFILPDMYKSLMDATKLTQAPIIRGDYWEYFDKKTLQKERYKRKKIFKDVNAPANEIKISDNLELFYITPSIWSAIYKKDFLIKNNISVIETKGASYQDVTFFAETLFEAESIYVVDKPLYSYRQTNMGSSINSKGKVLVIFESCRYLMEKLKQRNNKKFKEYKQILYFSFINHYYYNFYRIAHKYREQYIKEWQKELSKMIDNGLDLTLLEESRKKELEAIYSKSPKDAVSYVLWSKVWAPLRKYTRGIKECFQR